MKQWWVELVDESTRTVAADVVTVRDGSYWFTRAVPENRHGRTSELVALIPVRSVLLIEELVE